jgi:hypothetical protein
MPYTRSYGSDEVEIPAGGKLHLKALDDDRYRALFEPRDIPLDHNNTMRTRADWAQRHIEYVHGTPISEMDANITVSTEEGPEVGLREISAEKLNEVTGGPRCQGERVNHILEGQDDQVRYIAIHSEGYGVSLEGYGVSPESEEDYNMEVVFPRDMIEDAVELICESAIQPAEYRPRHKPQLQQNIVEVLEG